jgi:hypothetical protein
VSAQGYTTAAPRIGRTTKGVTTVPAKYTAIRDSLMARGKSSAEAKTSAARIFNATRKQGQKPVTGPHGKKKRKGKGIIRRAMK